MIETEELARIEEEGDYRRLVANVDISLGRTIVVLPMVGMTQPDRLSVEASPGVHIDCQNSLAGAINHACDANAAVRHFRIVAWRCITAGEEITINYNRTEWDMAEPFKCNCCGTLIRGKKYVNEKGSN